MANITANYTGLIPPPPGVTANFVNPPSLLKSHIAIHTVFLGLDTLCLAMRLYTRKFIHRKLALDDYVIMFAYCSLIAVSALNLAADKNGAGTHMWDFVFTREHWIATMKPFLIGVFPYILCAASIKLSCLLFYRHIFSASHRTMWFVNAGIGFILVSYSAMFLSESLECTPIQKLWDPAIVTGRCFDPKIQTYTNAALNSITDIYVLIVPIPALWGLPLGTGRKFRVIAVFGLGLGACITSIIRLGTMPELYSDSDVTWNMSSVGIWSIVEVNVGFICSCLLVFPAFLKRHVPPGCGKTVCKLFPCFGRRTEANDSTTKTYPSGSTYSHQNPSESLAVDSPMTSSFAGSTNLEPHPSNTTLITRQNVNDLEGQPRKGPHSG